jgi:hypothetical protein
MAPTARKRQRKRRFRERVNTFIVNEICIERRQGAKKEKAVPRGTAFDSENRVART